MLSISVQMDADYRPDQIQEDRSFGLDGQKKKRRRRKSKLVQALEMKKPVFEPGEDGQDV